MSVNPL